MKVDLEKLRGDLKQHNTILEERCSRSMKLQEDNARRLDLVERRVGILEITTSNIEGMSKAIFRIGDKLDTLTSRLDKQAWLYALMTSAVAGLVTTLVIKVIGVK